MSGKMDSEKTNITKCTRQKLVNMGGKLLNRIRIRILCTKVEINFL